MKATGLVRRIDEVRREDACRSRLIPLRLRWSIRAVQPRLALTNSLGQTCSIFGAQHTCRPVIERITRRIHQTRDIDRCHIDKAVPCLCRRDARVRRRNGGKRGRHAQCCNARIHIHHSVMTETATPSENSRLHVLLSGSKDALRSPCSTNRDFTAAAIAFTFRVAPMATAEIVTAAQIAMTKMMFFMMPPYS